jgi:uncharacterized protein (TIRG00374 family)
MNPRVKKWTWTIVRLAICAAALWYVLRGVTLDDTVYLADGTAVKGQVVFVGEEVQVRLDEETAWKFSIDQIQKDDQGRPRVDYGLRHAWSEGRKGYFLLALLIFLPAPALQGVRFCWMLRAQDIRLSAWEAIKITFAGNFLNFAAPIGATAGDVFKAYYASLHTHRKTEAATTVFLDRAVGLAGLVTTVALISNLSPPGSRLAPFANYTLAALAALVLGGIAYLSPQLRRIFRLRKILEKLPGSAHLIRIDDAATTLGRHKLLVLSGLLLTMFLQAIAALALYTLAIGLGMRAEPSLLHEYYAYFCTGSVVQALPGPPQGLGTVELCYSFFFADYGSPAQIVCLALGIRVVALTASLPGLLAVLTGAYKPRELARFQEAAAGEPAPPD